MSTQPIKTFGMIFKDPKFLDPINSAYETAAKMIDNVKKLRAILGADLSDLKWGDYQLILVPMSIWPPQAAARWIGSVMYARDDLAKIPNRTPLSAFDPVVPVTKCELLDAAVRKCFCAPAAGQSEPGIPMFIGVEHRDPADPDARLHDIRLVWDHDKAGQPLRLNLTMVCPSVP